MKNVEGDAGPAKAKPKAPAESTANPVPTGAEASAPPPVDSIEGILLGLDWDSLPGREQFEQKVVAEFKNQLGNLLPSFVYYCKASSECLSVETATRLHLAGFRKLLQHCSLEGPMLPIENIIRLFGKVASGGEMPATAKEVPATTMVDLKGFLSVVLQLAFYRQNPRQGVFQIAAAGKEGEPKKPADAPILPAVKAFLTEVRAATRSRSPPIALTARPSRSPPPFALRRRRAGGDKDAQAVDDVQLDVRGGCAVQAGADGAVRVADGAVAGQDCRERRPLCRFHFRSRDCQRDRPLVDRRRPEESRAVG